MFVVPLIYFGGLLAYLYKRSKEFTFSCYILSIYTLSSFCSVMMVLDGFKWESPYTISLWATLVYCFLLTLCLIPFIRFNYAAIHEFRPIGIGKFIKILSIVSSLYLLLYSVLSYRDIMEILSGDISKMRIDYVNGIIEHENWMQRMPPLQRLPFAFTNLLLSCPWILHFLAFWGLIVEKVKPKFIILLLLGSLISPVIGILGFDRSRTMYWMMSFVACYFFFRKYMSPKLNKMMLRVCVIFGSLLVVYFAFMTIARFGESDGGASNSIIGYLGQPFLNFVFFFDKTSCDFLTLHCLFPFTSEYLIKDEFESAVGIQRYLSDHSPYFYGVFYTYLGQLMTTAGIFITILFCILFNIVTNRTIKRAKHIYDALDVYKFLILSSVMYMGVISYYYTEAGRTFAVVLFFIAIRYYSKKQ